MEHTDGAVYLHNRADILQWAALADTRSRSRMSILEGVTCSAGSSGLCAQKATRGLQTAKHFKELWEWLENATRQDKCEKVKYRRTQRMFDGDYKKLMLAVEGLQENWRRTVVTAFAEQVLAGRHVAIVQVGTSTPSKKISSYGAADDGGEIEEKYAFLSGAVHGHEQRFHVRHQGGNG
jgi:hypothetical protein